MNNRPRIFIVSNQRHAHVFRKHKNVIAFLQLLDNNEAVIIEIRPRAGYVGVVYGGGVGGGGLVTRRDKASAVIVLNKFSRPHHDKSRNNIDFQNDNILNIFL